MLKIRIAGTEDELRQIAHKAGSARVKRFKREKRKRQRNGNHVFRPCWLSV